MLQVIEMSGVCAASDIWSVGCTVIELLTCVPPYYDLQPMPALFRIVQVSFILFSLFYTVGCRAVTLKQLRSLNASLFYGGYGWSWIVFSNWRPFSSIVQVGWYSQEIVLNIFRKSAGLFFFFVFDISLGIFEIATTGFSFLISQDEHPPIPDGLSPDITDFLRQCFKKVRQRKYQMHADYLHVICQLI